MIDFKIINPLLQQFVFFTLIVLAVSALFMGIQIYKMGRTKIANRKGLVLCLCSSLWSTGYAWVLVSTSVTMVSVARFMGMLGFYMWIAMALSYIFEIDLIKKYPLLCNITTIVMLLISLMISIQAFNREDITVEAAPYGMTFVMNDSIHKTFRYIYIIITLIFAFVVILRLYFTRTLKREKRKGLFVVMAMFMLPVGGISDAILPFFGYKVFPSSCYTSFIATYLLYYVTKENNSLMISMENVSRYITESVQMPFFVFNKECDMLLVNRSGGSYIGNGLKDTSRLSCDLLFESEKELLSDEIKRKVGEHETYFTIQGNAICKKAICSMQFTVVYDKFGDCLCIIMLVNDITNEYITIEKLRASQKAEERANHAKTIFLANMSHEIRTPINTILGMDEMILRDTKEIMIKEYAINIQHSGKLLMSIINDILDFSKIESGKMEIISEEYELGSMLNDIMNMMSIKAEDKGLYFAIEADETLPHRLFGDEMRIRQIISNLLNNSVKYTKKGQVILKLGWKLTSPRRLDLLIEVMDTGIGIKKEDMDKLFLSFERLDIKHNRSIEGSGLGLSITNQLLSLMNGKMEIESEYGVGSKFKAIIPQKIIDFEPLGDYRAKYEQSLEEKITNRKSYIAPEAKILVVDDNDMNLAVVKGFLKKMQVQTTLALSGEECLECLKNNDYNLIFMDHMMPEMDGIETLKRIRTDFPKVFDKVPIIALTANALSGAKEMYLSKGFSDYLAKPLESMEMEDMLIKYLPKEMVILKKE